MRNTSATEPALTAEHSASKSEFLQWHPYVHEQWVHEQLHFFRLGFSPTYPRKRVRRLLLELFEEFKIRSYVGYELLGVFDVMLRVWLPQHVPLEAFREALGTRLKAANVTTSDSFTVYRQASNWLWTDPSGEGLRPPEVEALAQGPLSAEQLRRISFDTSFVSELEKAGLLKRLPKAAGVKFFMVLLSPQYATNEALDRLYETVGAVLDEAGLVESSLYIGQGFGSGIALIMGRVAFDRFYDLGNNLSLRIAALTDLLAIRTYTLPTGVSDFICYAEDIPAGEDGAFPSVDPFPTVEDLLRRGETQVSEMKGSAFVQLDPLFKTGHRIAREDTVAAKSFVRAIVGLLNGSGGTLALGVLEKGRYDDEVIAEHFGSSPRVGGYICLGVDTEIAGDPDAFERRILDTVRTHVEPSVLGLIKVEFADVEGRTIVLIRVTRPLHSWFYADKQFVVRTGNQTHVLDGPDMDSYRQTFPRR